MNSLQKDDIIAIYKYTVRHYIQLRSDVEYLHMTDQCVDHYLHTILAIALC